MEVRKIILNDTQQRAVRHYDIPEVQFVNKEWFDHSNYFMALGFLLKTMPMSEAFSILENTTPDQAQGICDGFSRNEVLGLNREQIQGMLKFGLTREEVKELNEEQINAYVRLKHLGVTSDLLHKYHEFKSDSQVEALGYLLIIKKMDIERALALVSPLHNAFAEAISYGLMPEDFSQLNTHHAIKKLIAKNKNAWVQSQNDIKDLNEFQIQMMDELFHWEVTIEQLKKYPWLNSRQQNSAIIHLVTKQFFSFDAAIKEIEGLNKAELDGIEHDLLRKDVQGLNEFQIKTLYRFRTAKNGLNANHFKDKKWFNSEKHVDAFWMLITINHFTIEQVFAELDGLDEHQAKQIYDGKSRDDIVGLNQYMLSVIKSVKGARGELQGKHLRGKEWFNSEEHAAALHYLLVKTNNFTVQMIDQLRFYTQVQLKLIAKGYAFDAIKKLTAIQTRILVAKDKYYFISADSIEKAVWLKTEEQYDIFELLYEKMSRHHENVLTVLQQATKENVLPKLRAALENNTNRSEWSYFTDICQLDSLLNNQLGKQKPPVKQTSTLKQTQTSSGFFDSIKKYVGMGSASASSTPSSKPKGPGGL